MQLVRGRTLATTIVVAVAMVSLVLTSALALSPIEEQKLLASDGAVEDRFGQSVAVDDDIALIGAPSLGGLGAAYVFERAGGVWTEQSILMPSDIAADDRSGFSVSLSGDTALVGAPLHDDNGSSSGAAYVFVWDGIQWNEQAELTAADGAAGDVFGYSVALSGDFAVIGALNDDDNGSDSGSAYVFERTGSVWTQEIKLTPGDGAANEFFGTAVTVVGDRALISADANTTGPGSVYVFDRMGGIWTETAKLTAGDGTAMDAFGIAVSLSGDRALIGAHLDDVSAINSGSAYVFAWDGFSWTEEAKLTPSDGASSDVFGIGLALDGDHAVIGAYNIPGVGAGYVFVRDGASWTEEYKLTANDGAVDDGFGGAVSVDGETTFIGAFWDDDSGSKSGSAYVFELDSDDDGVPAYEDNCPTVFNPGQEQTGNNVGGQFGDACVHPTVTIHPSANIAPGAVIGAGTTVKKNIVVGAGADIGANVKLKAGSFVGENAVIGDDTSIGKRSTIGDGTIIGASVTIARDATIGDIVTVGDNTSIGSDTSIEDNVAIGMNVAMGKRVTVLATAVVPDSAVVPNDAVIAP